ncbi:MAG: zf-HC2 domain-containing protein [Candidatus Omnitrophica bacterium]|nr:zf-HC2 domain-containing protein [Candidatus Omnitrophota bacterium]
MKCKNLKKYLLTDYLDNQMTVREEREAAAHLAECPQCQQLLREARIKSVAPLSDLSPQEPPVYLWHRIRLEIESRPAPRFGWLADFVTNIQNAFFMPRPVFVLSSFATLLVMVGLFINLNGVWIKGHEENGKDSISYLSFLSGAAELSGGETENGLGTSIEQYFL